MNVHQLVELRLGVVGKRGGDANVGVVDQELKPRAPSSKRPGLLLGAPAAAGRATFSAARGSSTHSHFFLSVRMRLPLLFAVSLALFSCSKSDDPSLAPSAGTELATEDDCGAPGPSGYQVLLRTQQQAVQLPGTVETFLFSKDNVFNTSGSDHLIASLIRQGDLLSLRYCGVVHDGLTTDIGPAQSAISLQDLPAQVYRLRITVRNRHTTGTLDLTTTPARLSIADTTVAAVWR